MADGWRVFKFGGSSVADAACMERVARVLEAEPSERLAVVLSACRGVTDALLGLVGAAERQDLTADGLEVVRERHLEIARALCDAKSLAEYTAELDADCHDIRGILHAAQLTR